MKDFFLYDFYYLRTPAFPVEALLKLNQVTDAALKENKDHPSWKQLKEIYADPRFQEAIYIASSDLYAGLQDWLENKEYNAKKTEKLLKSLHRYYSRMCTRSTPYGLFAGGAYGTVTDGPSKITFSADRIRKHVRFDMSFVIELTKRLTETEELQSAVRFYVNNSLYKIGDKYIYVEYTLQNGKRSYTLSALSASFYIDSVVSRARNGATLDELMSCVVGSGAAREAILNFVKGLIAAQVLVSELSPAVTSEDAMMALTDSLEPFEHAAEVRRNVLDAYNRLKDNSVGLHTYMQVENIARKLVPAKGLEIIQVDLYYNMMTNNISTRVMQRIADASARLVSTADLYTPEEMEEFKQKFVKRYEEREIPLVQALDPDTGIGYGLAVNGVVENMPLLNGLALRVAGQDDKVIKGDAFGKLVFRKMRAFFKGEIKSIKITDDDLLSLRPETLTAPKAQCTSSFIFGSIIASSVEAMDEGDFRFYPVQLHTPFAGRILTRFAQGEPVLRGKLEQCFEDEKKANPDVILAEIVYMPEGHYANLALRPRFRQYEIPYLCSASAEKEFEIDINDLMVSVRMGRVVLRSARLNKEVRPQLTNSHNSRQGQPLYRFLNDVQGQQVNPGFLWRWGQFNEEPYLPRVEYENFIVSRERWLLRRRDIDGMLKPALDKYLNDFRNLHHVPRYVVLSQGDNELVIDLDNETSRDHLVQQLKRTDVTLNEFLHSPENCFIKGADGSYSNEIILPMGTIHPAFPALAFPGQNKTMPERFFAPGSEWLYVKIYGGNKTLEAVLTEIIQPFADKLLREKAIDKWFFIRFNDPDNHIRVRFHRSDNLSAWMDLLPQLNTALEPLLRTNQLTRIMLDTYTREIERYGADTMLEGETLFFADSIAVTSFLDCIAGDEGEQLRWQMGLYSIDCLLNDFGYSLDQKQRLLGNLRQSFFSEFNSNKKRFALMLERSLNEKYRAHYQKIRDTLSGALTDVDEILVCFKNRSAVHSEAVRSIKEKVALFANPQVALNGLMASYIHMCMNRLFISRQRNHELVIYHYLNKYYESQIARERQTVMQVEASTENSLL